MVDLSDAQTFWLNVTNIALGILTVVCWVAAAAAVLLEGRRRFHHF